MSSNENGFEDMANHFGKLAKVDPEKISIQSLESAAEYYVEKLMPAIPTSLFKKKHARDQVKVVMLDDEVKVVFENTAFYWRFLDKGTTRLKALNFKDGTWEQNKIKIEDIMTRKLIEELGE